jgi:hypothetical protein
VTPQAVTNSAAITAMTNIALFTVVPNHRFVMLSNTEP